MMRILQDLLMLARLKSRRDPGMKRAVNFSTLVSEVVEEARLASGAQGGHVFHTEIAPDIGVLGNQEDLHAAVSNLVMNAVRYPPAGGAITVALYRCQPVSAWKWSLPGRGSHPSICSA